MSIIPNRTIWTTETIRAEDLHEKDTVLVNGVWREIFDVWKDGDDPAYQFGEDNPTTAAIRAKVHWNSPCWVAIRYVDEDRSTVHQIEDALHFFRLRELVQVQTPAPGFPALAEGPLAGPLSVLGPLGLLGALRAAVELYGDNGDPNDVLSISQVEQLTALAEHFGNQ